MIQPRKTTRRQLLFFSFSGKQQYGAAKSMLLLATGLIRNGQDITFATGEEGPLCDMFRSAGIPVRVIHAPQPLVATGGKSYKGGALTIAKTAALLASYGPRLARACNDLRPSIIYANDLRSTLMLWAARITTRAPLIWYVRGGDRIPALSQLGTIIASDIVLISRAARKALPRRPPSRRPRVHVNYVGIDERIAKEVATARQQEAGALRRSLDLPADATIILQTASLHPRKGQDTLLQAVSRMPNPQNILVVLAGSVASEQEDYAERLRSLAANSHVNVRFVGWTDRVADYLAAADIFVLPSREEGLGRATLEAMSAELPVIVSRAGGSEETVVHGESGWIIEPDDVSGLTTLLADLVSTPAERRRLGKAARQRQLEVFSETEYIRGFCEILDRILERQRDNEAPPHSFV